MAMYTPEYQPNGSEIAVIKTSKGAIRVQLAGNDAPIHVGNFVELARKGFYDNLKFHRYVPNFVIQGGCPNGNGMGGPGYSIKGEFAANGFKQNTLKHGRSRLYHQAGVHHQPQQFPRRRCARHGAFYESRLCGLSVLLVPRPTA